MRMSRNIAEISGIPEKVKQWLRKLKFRLQRI